MRYFVLFFVLSFAQYVSARKIDGEVKLNTKRTIQVTFSIPFDRKTKRPDYERLQRKVKCVDSQGNKLEIFPGACKEYMFRWGSIPVRMVSVSNTLPQLNAWPDARKIFLKLEVDGSMKMFSYYYSVTHTYSSPGGGQIVQTVRYIDVVLKKRTGVLLKTDREIFRYQMINYLKDDCMELAEKVKSGAFADGQYSLIVHEYNQTCGKLQEEIEEEEE